MKKEIPNEVKKLAERVYCREPKYIGDYGGSEVYNEKGSSKAIPDPTGLPILILWNGREAKFVEDMEALNVLSHFE